MLRFLPLVLSCLLLAAHHLRGGEPGLVAAWLAVPFLILLRRGWVRIALPTLLLLGAAEWVLTAAELVRPRIAQGLPHLRLAAIVGGAAVFTAVSALGCRGAAARARFHAGGEPAAPGAAAFLLTLALLGVVQVAVTDPAGLLLERFLTGGGWLTALGLAVYAALLASAAREPRRMRRARPRVWAVFSAVFFLQLGLGLLVSERFLMTGALHLPIPALIVAGPIYRGEGLFMPVLFSASVLLVGPAWCSWLCYVGAWDDAAARQRRRPVRLPRWRGRLRIALLAAVVLAALGLGRAGVPAVLATWLAAGFGLVGVGVMAAWSRRTGAMTHCTGYCPIGFLATRLGRVSPFRIRIDAGCTDCGACTKACRYDALGVEDVLRRRPAESCTLCGDCVTMCHGRSIDYRFAGLAPGRARSLFVVLVVSLHAAFIGVARI